MSKQANKTVIGAFVVGALGLAVIGILLFGSGRFFKEKHEVVMYFEGSVGGLNIGAPMVFRGVKIGTVKDIQLIFDIEALDFRIPVTAEIEPDRMRRLGAPDPKNLGKLIEKGLRAKLASQSFVTGQLMIALDLHPDKPAEFHGDGKVPEIPTVPTMLQELTKKLQDLPLEELVKAIAGAAEGVDKLVNSKEIKETLVSLDETMKDIRLLVKNLDPQISAVVGTLDQTLRDYGNLAKGADEKVTMVVRDADETIKEYGKLARDADKAITPLAVSLGETLKSAQMAAKQAEKTLSNTEALTSPDSRVIHEVVKVLQELSSASRSIRVLAEYLERHPEALIHGKGGAKGR